MGVEMQAESGWIMGGGPWGYHGFICTSHVNNNINIYNIAIYLHVQAIINNSWILTGYSYQDLACSYVTVNSLSVLTQMFNYWYH